MKLLEVENLTVQYPGSANPACKVSFQVESGELLGIAGASGAGKSTAMLALMGILPEQVQITSEKLKQHGTKAMIFQDASASLNPLIRVGKQLTETILAHQRCTGKEARERAETLLDEVGIQDPGQRMKQYPFELSGGMKQSDTQTFAKNWGYSKYFLWLLDSGGTVFTNALFHVTEAVNQNDLDPALYTLEKSYADYDIDSKEAPQEGYKLYSANYRLPFAMTVASSFASEDLGVDWVDLHNKFYTALSGDKEPLVKGMSYSVKKSDTVLEYNTQISGNAAVYLKIVDINNRNSDANASWLISSMHVYVNDKEVPVPTLGDVENTAYFTDYNNNLLYLGCFDNESIDIRIEYDDPWYLKVSEVSFAQLDMDKMEKLCRAYENTKCDVSYTNDSLTVKLDGSATKNYALIPVVYSKNWKVSVNGQQVQAKEIAGLFTGVKIHSGENTITMEFEPQGRKEGLLITLATLLILVVCLVIDHFKKINVPAWIQYCAVFVWLQLLNAVVVAMFLIPVIAAVPAFLYQIILKIMQIL